MTARAYYNEIDAFCCDVLRARIADGSLPEGDVDERDIRAVDPNDLKEYGQVHLFAGIGGGGLACRLAGVPDDFRIITAGVPCQPASQAGKRLGARDERWLWPEFFRVLRGLRSHYALVEQPPGIASLNAGVEWRWILGELAAIVPSFEVSRVSASDVGAPHERERIWIVVDPDEQGWVALRQSQRSQLEGASGHIATRRHEGMVDSASRRLASESVGSTPQETDREGARRGDVSDGCKSLGNSESGGRRARGGESVRRTGGRCSSMGDAEQLGCDSRLVSGSGETAEGREARRPAGRPVGAVGDTSCAGREERDASAESTRARHAAGERAGMGDAGLGSVQPIDDALRTSAQRREDANEEIQRERGGRDARNYGELLRPWRNAARARGADGTVRIVPREAAEAGPESALWPVADGIPGRVARLRAIGNAWVPQAAVPALQVILARYAAEVAA